jgi:hypothetical protein
MNEDQLLDDDEIENEDDSGEIEVIVQQAVRRNPYVLDARRKIERLMELRRLRELDDRINLNDLD